MPQCAWRGQRMTSDTGFQYPLFETVFFPLLLPGPRVCRDSVSHFPSPQSLRHSQSLRLSQQVFLPTKPCAHPHSFCPFCFLLSFSSFPSGLIRCELFSVCAVRWRFSFTICWRDDGSSAGYFWPWTVVPWVYFWLFHCIGLCIDLCASTRPSYLQTWKQKLWYLQLCPAPKDCLWLFGGLIWFPMSFAYWLFFFS